VVSALSNYQSRPDVLLASWCESYERMHTLAICQSRAQVAQAVLPAELLTRRYSRLIFISGMWLKKMLDRGLAISFWVVLTASADCEVNSLSRGRLTEFV
jgi:hypothetical protein